MKKLKVIQLLWRVSQGVNKLKNWWNNVKIDSQGDKFMLNNWYWRIVTLLIALLILSAAISLGFKLFILVVACFLVYAFSKKIKQGAIFLRDALKQILN